MNKEKINKRYSFIFIVRSFVRSFANFQKKINKQRLLIPTLPLSVLRMSVCVSLLPRVWLPETGLR